MAYIEQAKQFIQEQQNKEFGKAGETEYLILKSYYQGKDDYKKYKMES